MTALDRLGSRRFLASTLGVVAGGALLTAGWWFLVGFGPGPGACACSPPGIDFAFTANASDGSTTVRVTHERGDPIPAAELFVVVDGESRPWPTANASGDVSGRPAVVVGDSYALTGVAAGTTVRVVWRPPDADVRATLAEHTVGE